MYTTCFRLAIQIHGRVPARTYMTDVYRTWIGMEFHSYPQSIPVYCLIPVMVLSLAVNLFSLRMGCGRRRSSFSSLTSYSVSRVQCIMTVTIWVSFRTLSLCFPLKTFSLFPFNVNFLSIFWLLHESSRTQKKQMQQQHIHMYKHIVCDRTSNTPKNRTAKKKNHDAKILIRICWIISRTAEIVRTGFGPNGNTSRWTLSFPNFKLAPGVCGECDGVFRSRFSRFT